VCVWDSCLCILLACSCVDFGAASQAACAKALSMTMEDFPVGEMFTHGAMEYIVLCSGPSLYAISYLALWKLTCMDAGTHVCVSPAFCMYANAQAWALPHMECCIQTKI